MPPKWKRRGLKIKELRGDPGWSGAGSTAGGMAHQPSSTEEAAMGRGKPSVAQPVTQQANMRKWGQRMKSIASSKGVA